MYLEIKKRQMSIYPGARTNKSKCCLCGKSFEITNDNLCYCSECIDKEEAKQLDEDG